MSELETIIKLIIDVEGRLQERIDRLEDKLPSLLTIAKWGGFGGGIVAAVATLAFWFRG